jgi:hypothetical protein
MILPEDCVDVLELRAKIDTRDSECEPVAAEEPSVADSWSCFCSSVCSAQGQLRSQPRSSCERRDSAPNVEKFPVAGDRCLEGESSVSTTALERNREGEIIVWSFCTRNYGSVMRTRGTTTVILESWTTTTRAGSLVEAANLNLRIAIHPSLCRSSLAYRAEYSRGGNPC